MFERKINEPHKEYVAALDRWRFIDRVCRGVDVIGEIYPLDEAEKNNPREKQYAKRAKFVRIAGRTAKGMVGMVFAKDPILTTPLALDYVNKNVDGAGISIYQQSQHTLGAVVRKGRAGLLVDYPITDGTTSVADMAAGKVYATIQLFGPEQIINWRLVPNGAQMQLGRVVIQNVFEDEYGDDIEIIRELVIEGGIYISREYRKNEDGEWTVYSESYPRDGKGSYWHEIPFVFVGSETNTPIVDEQPMYDLCDINIGHYNNSAIYEDSVFMLGQPQPWMVGANEDYLKSYKESGMYIGCGRLIGVPDRGQFGITQVQPNTLAREAMKDKEELMARLGATLLTRGDIAKTATQSKGEQAVQHSILSLASSNVSEAYTRCLQWMAQYMAAEDEGLEYTLSKDFVESNANAETLKDIVASWQAGATPFSDVVAWQQRHGIIDPEKTLEDVMGEIGVNNLVMPDLDREDDNEDEVKTNKPVTINGEAV